MAIAGLESGTLAHCFGVTNFKPFYPELREGTNERKNERTAKPVNKASIMIGTLGLLYIQPYSLLVFLNHI